jgi:hypothetical protein
MAVQNIKHAAADRSGSVATVADTVKELRVFGAGTLRLYSADALMWVSDGVDDGDSPAPTSDFWTVPAGSGDGPTISQKQWARVVKSPGYTSIYIWTTPISELRWDFR